MYFGGMSYLIYVLPAVLLAMYAQNKVKSTYKKYSKFKNRKGYTGEEIARKILAINGIRHVTVEPIKGELTDHYDPKGQVVRLSEGVYGSKSLSAVGIAAHECGHAIQDNEDYAFLRIRHLIVPAVNIANRSAMPMVIAGILFGSMANMGSLGNILLQIGIILFTVVVVFHFVTLPVEFNASSRAIKVLESENFLDEEEIIPIKRVLKAAALTYVAAAAVALGNLLRLIALSRGRRR